MIKNKQEAILKAVSFSAGEFMKTRDWEKNIQQMLEHLGVSTEVSRVYIFKDEAGLDQTLLSSQIFEWVADGIEPQIDNKELQNISLSFIYPQWDKDLRNGKPVICNVKDLPVNEQRLLLTIR